MRELPFWLRTAIFGWLAFWAAVHLYWGGFGFPEPITIRSLHLLVFTPPLFLLYPAFEKRSPKNRPSVFDWLWAAASAAPHLWVFIYADAVNDRMEYVDPFTPLMMALAITCMVTMLEAIRRAVEPGLAWMTAGCLLYMFVGHHLPGVLNTRVFTTAEIMEAAWLVPTAGGVYGPLTGIVATTIAVFILFGSFMQGSGTGRLFANFGAAVAGRYTGGPAKVAVVSSGLFGTMSGSSVSNVITTGAMTIPLMVRIGYKPAVAAGIESAASVGGALMPPVMGAAAFVMAEITNIPYGDILVAAAIGAVLYYFAILVAVHFEAKKIGIEPMALQDIPAWREVLADAHLIIPIGLLVYLMTERWSGNYAAFCSTLAMVAVSLLRARTRMGWRAVIESLTNAGLTMAPLAVAIAASGVVVSVLTATGMVVAFGGIIKEISGGSFGLLALMLCITVLVLGLGIPTTPSYIIAAAIGVPQLLELGRPLGVDMMQAHLFIFYFAVIADATPPVAAAAFAAAAIAKASPTIASVHASRFGIAGFTVGFAFLYDPGIMLRGGILEILSATAIQVIALVMITSAYAGYLLRPMGWPVRIVFAVVGLFAAFGHIAPDTVRLAVSAATLGGVGLAQFLFTRKDAMIRISALLLGLVLTTPLLAQTVAPQQAGATLSGVRARGVLNCGISTGDPAWSQPDNQGVWQGLDADLCRAVAAAVLGDPSKVAWHPLTGQTRFPALSGGQIEMLARTTTWTFLRDAVNGLNFTALYFMDGQGFLVKSDSGIQHANQLDGASICLVSASTHELNLQDWARSINIRFQPVVFADKDEARRAYESGRCDAYTGDSSQLASVRAGFPEPSRHRVLPERISKEPYAVAVRHGDDQWFDIVRFVVLGLIEAEELGVTRENAARLATESDRPAVQRLLGRTGDLGPAVGLDRAWLLNAIRAVGNYGEIYDRHLGANSPVQLPRGPNALWNAGGLLWSPPIR
ncbi:TRAP transporter fused permease subunit [Neoroseomonas oryzicola]|uniref:TRAP transporter fused permease subunit n=1 Tax=Neoroseomonas oryzicola TaxID=535904 RepID=A0A9X9WK77_9PROT|nr:TRAP transporter fused permease subunit [Neoroseomonas oryzicola]NKE20273.1 TRAP transporter fused permease subunit [Neoroseomonas oryzicola]